MPNTLRRGIGAVCRVKKRFLKPSRLVDECRHASFVNQDLIFNLLIVGRELKKVNGRDQMCILFRHDAFQNNEILYVTERYAVVVTEGPVDQLFTSEGNAAVSSSTNNVSSTNLNDVEDNHDPDIPDEVWNLQHEEDVSNEDIQRVRSMGFEVDDDNDPAPENIPAANTGITNPAGSNVDTNRNTGSEAQEPTLGPGQAWMENMPFCQRKASVEGMPSFTDHEPSINCNKPISDHSFLELFLLFFGMNLVEMILTATNQKLPDRTKSISLGEFIRFLGIRLAMCSCNGYTVDDFWQKRDPDAFHNPPFYFGNVMSNNRFHVISDALSFTTLQPPEFRDKFWKVRQMISMWNENMKKIFNAGWVTCLDESMCIWYNRWTCPGWMFVPRKPHPFGNEYHTMACGLCTIIFVVLLVEGKDRPVELDVGNSYSAMGKTVALLLTMCESIFQSGRVVVLDSGFCVLQGIVELYKKGVFAAAYIKKRRFWPKYVKGDDIDKFMKDDVVGTTRVHYGILDRIKYYIFNLKEPDYTSKIMSTYGSLSIDENDEKTSRRLQDGTNKLFYYVEVFRNHFRYRHVVDDHNNFRHSNPSIEGSWLTHSWECRQFQYVVATSEVNVWLALRYWVWKDDSPDQLTLLDFRRELAHQMVYNSFIMTPEESTNNVASCVTPSPKRKRQKTTRYYLRGSHELETAPPHAKSFSTDGKW
eukprot:CAMPEP_0178944722 /NCGR_PEP_ID=MMETSP0789-20121207/3318_1 /TAXON_ID=3005 /ORGANISM="Rhizosolenia setigera, Strain CCMP 1694" /LENGTH=700 /DNA_ID=CAMNT_0020624495 /DNA_START=47 /DNA_END=2146 /DNA_ORIENTATION=-